MAVTDTGLVARYRINEAGSGQVPTELVDTGPHARNLPIPNYGGSNLNFVTESGRIGLRSTSTAGDQRARLALASDNPIRTNLHGGQKFTIEIVYDHSSGFASGSRIFGLNGSSGENGAMMLKSEGSSVYLSFNDTNNIYAGWTPSAGIHRIWIIVDTTQATQADRVKVSVDGAAAASTSNALALNATLNVNTGCDLIMFNRYSGSTYGRSVVGALFYAAVYNVAFDNARITAHDADLSTGDDAGGSPPDTTPPTTSSLVITPTSPSLVNASFGTNEDGTGYFLVSNNASESRPTVETGTSAAATVGSGCSVTGLTWTAGQYLHIVQKDNATTPNWSTVVSTLISDNAAPLATGPIVVSNVVPTGCRMGGFSATDNLGVTGWRYRLDAGSWVTFGDGATTYVDLSGLTNGLTMLFELQARDAAGNWSNTLSKTFTVGASSVTVNILQFAEGGNIRMRMALAAGLRTGGCTLIWRERRRAQDIYSGGYVFSSGTGTWDGGAWTVLFVTHGADGTFDATGQRLVGGGGTMYHEIAGMNSAAHGSANDYIASNSSLGPQVAYLVQNDVWVERACTITPNGAILEHVDYVDFIDPTKVIRQNLATSDPVTPTNQYLDFGAPHWITDGTEDFRGDVTHLKVFSRGLSVSEIRQELDNYSDTPVVSDCWYSNYSPTSSDISDKKPGGTPHPFAWNNGIATDSTEVFTLSSSGAAPVVTVNPANSSKSVGQTADFTVEFTGSPAPTVQWEVLLGGASSLLESLHLPRSGNDDYIHRVSTGLDYNSVYTVFSWFKITTDPNDYQHILNISPTTGYTGSTDFIGTDTNGTLFRYGCAGGSANSFLTASELTPNIWYWAAMVRESATSLKFYLGTDNTDGALVATLTNDVTSRPVSGVVTLGGFNGSNLLGRLAAPRIWAGQALTLTELHSEAASANLVKTTGIWSAPACKGADLTAALLDVSGQARHWTAASIDMTIAADGPIAGATWADVTGGSVVTDSDSSVYTTEVLTLTENGNRYRAELTNASGSVTSTDALLTVTTDDEVPVLPGPLVVTNITQSSFDSACPVASDNIGVEGYEMSENGGSSWTDKALVRTHSHTGKTAGSVVSLRWRAYDAAGNRSVPLSQEVQIEHPGVLGSTILLTTGDGLNGPGALFNYLSPADADKRYYWTMIRDVVNGVLTLNADGTFTYEGTTDYFEIEVFENSVSLGIVRIDLVFRRRLISFS